MASKYTFRGVADMTQHDAAIKKSASEVYKYQKKVKDSENQLKSFTGSIQGSIGGLQGLADNLKSGNIVGFAQGLRTLVPVMGEITAGAAGMGTALSVALGPIGMITAAVAAISAVGIVAGKSFETFNNSLKGLSALTGVSGQPLKEMGDDAVNMSMKFGQTATDIIESMKKVGSAAPELLKNKTALEGVTKSAIVLAKASDMTVEETSKAITTAMNQFGLAGDQSDRIINSLATGAQAGAGEVDYLTTAMEKAGSQASLAGMSFEQTVGAIETLAPKFSSAEVAGTALNHVLIALTTQANSQFNPNIVGMNKALENLANAHLSATQKVQMFGREGLTAANILMSERKELQDMTKAVSNSNGAYDQMATKSGSLESLMNKLKSAWDGFMISIGQSAPIQVVIGLLGLLLQDITAVLQGLKKFMDFWNTLTSVVGALCMKLWNNFIKPVWDNIVKAVTNSALYKNCAKIWQAIVNAAKNAIQWISEKWHQFLKWLGIESKEIKLDGGKITQKVDVQQTTTNTVKGKTAKLPKTKVDKNKVEFASGSLDELEKQVSEAQKRLSSGLLNKGETKDSLNKLIADLQQQVKEKKIELGLEPTIEQGSEEEAQKKVTELKDKLSKMSSTNPLFLNTKIDLENAEENLNNIQNTVSKDCVVITPTVDEGSLKDLEDTINKKKAIIETKVYGSEDYKLLSTEIKELTDKKHKIELQIETDGLSKIDKVKNKFEKCVNQYGSITQPFEGIDGVISSFDNLNEKIKEGANGWELFISIMHTFDSVLGAIGDTIDSVSTIMDVFKTSTEAATTASNVAATTDATNTQTQIANSAAKTSASAGEAIAGATASGAGMPFPYNLVAIAAGIAAVIAALSSIGSFASGGIIGGSTTIGDYNIARVNGGEMILNSRHQNNLFRAIDQNRLGGGGGTIVGGDIRIKGQDLYIALKNYSKAQNKLGKSTGII